MGTRKSLTLLIGVVIGALVGFGVGVFTLPFGPPRWIVFPETSVRSNEFAGYASIGGRIDDRPDYPNNYVQISCRKDLKSCLMVKLEEIDRPNQERASWPQIGDVDAAEVFTVTHWDKNSLTAVDDGFCEVRQLNADFVLSEAEIVVEPHNLTDMNCKGTSPVVVRYPLQKQLDAFDPKYKRR